MNSKSIKEDLDCLSSSLKAFRKNSKNTNSKNTELMNSWTELNQPQLMLCLGLGLIIFLGKIEKDNLVTTLSRLDKSFIVSFNLWINKHITSVQYTSVLHLTTGSDYSRIPAVWLHKGMAHISNNVNNNQNYWKNAPYGGLKEGRWIPITISQQEVYKKVKF